MTIIGKTRVATHGEHGELIIKEYRLSDSPEFYCHTGLHAWYSEQDADKCCKDGWTQGLFRGIPYLMSQAAIDKKAAELEQRAINQFFTRKP